MVEKIIRNQITFHNILYRQWNIISSSKLKQWIIQTINQEKFLLKKINIIFLSEEELLKINIDFLNHNYYTDVITFDYSMENKISGEIYISIDTVKKNAEKYQQQFETELYRVMIHGVLHLCKYKDKTKKQKEKMTQKENFYLQQIFPLNF